MTHTFKLYVPAGQSLVESITNVCQCNAIGTADVCAIGSLTNIWVLINPDGSPSVRNFSTGPLYEMTIR